jgi:16S rRNA C967 or C1407 C5-methylase (RsmB/RsmF family)/NOL1/NOP2/fmu family ribosome biogenesis protein
LLPEPFLNSLIDLPGFELESFKRVHALGEQVTSIRKNSAKPFDENQVGFLNHAESIPWCQYGYYLPQRPSFVTDPLWHAGAYYVQEASSMFIQYMLEQILPDTNGKVALDLCAAPGGKSTLLANHFREGLVVANETIKSRNAILVENLTKWGSDHVVVTQNDPVNFKSLPQFFDLMLIDAPCSGSGLFRKDPDAIKEWSEESVQHCSTRQARIVEDSVDALKEGGYLIYSTCSYSFDEDEKMMDHIAAMPGMQSILLDPPKQWNIVECFSPIHHAKGFRFYPDKIKGEGFFVAVFQKQAPTNGNYYSADFKWSDASKKEKETIASYFKLPAGYHYINHQNTVIAVPALFEMHIKALFKNLYVKKMGMPLGEIKGKDFIPSHALAMSQWTELPFGTVTVNLETALQYLRRADLVLEGDKGWQAVSYQNVRLGWAKLLPNRTNNYYPTEWRILKF